MFGPDLQTMLSERRPQFTICCRQYCAVGCDSEKHKQVICRKKKIYILLRTIEYINPDLKNLYETVSYISKKCYVSIPELCKTSFHLSIQTKVEQTKQRAGKIKQNVQIDAKYARCPRKWKVILHTKRVDYCPCAHLDYVHATNKKSQKNNNLDGHVTIVHHRIQLTEFGQHGTNSFRGNWDRRLEHMLTSIRIEHRR